MVYRLNPYTAHRVFQTLVLHCQGVLRSRTNMVRISEEKFKEYYPVSTYRHFVSRFPTVGDFRPYVISSIIADNTLTHIRDLYNNEKYFNRKFDRYVKRKHKFVSLFEEELNGIFNSLEKNNYKFRDWIYGGGILAWYMKGKIEIDTFTMLDNAFHFLNRGEKNNQVFNNFYLTFVEQYAKLKEQNETTKERTKEIIETIVTERRNRNGIITRSV